MKGLLWRAFWRGFFSAFGWPAEVERPRGTFADDARALRRDAGALQRDWEGLFCSCPNCTHPYE